MDSYPTRDTTITQSLFSDRASSISEENIARILDGNYRLPQKLRVVLVKVDNGASKNGYSVYGNDEQMLKMQQSYVDRFSDDLKKNLRVMQVQVMPSMLVSHTPSFTSLREAAVRMQADVLVVFSITSDLYAKYKLFSKPDVKAYATTQLLLLDVRTGLIPFSTISTRDFLAHKTKEQLSELETANDAQAQAALLTIRDISDEINTFLSK